MEEKSAEFALIDTYFKNLTNQQEVIVGIGDDAAVIASDNLSHWVVAADTLVEAVHFPAEATAEEIASRSLCVNLSDMAAMGAVAKWFILALTLPSEKASDAWLRDFSQSLGSIAAEHNIALIGGDTTAGPLTVSITLIGEVPKGKSLQRCGAKPGDLIFVSGTLGDGAAALDGLKDNKKSAFAQNLRLLKHFYRPQPQTALGKGLRDYASACIDISDGLVSDLGHVCRASGVSAEISTQKLPVHPDLKQVPKQQYLQWALTGGDDYQLCFTIPENKRDDFDAWLSNQDFSVTEIGKITPIHHNRSQVKIDGSALSTANGGYEHFQK